MCHKVATNPELENTESNRILAFSMRTETRRKSVIVFVLSWNLSMTPTFPCPAHVCLWMTVKPPQLLTWGRSRLNFNKLANLQIWNNGTLRTDYIFKEEREAKKKSDRENHQHTHGVSVPFQELISHPFFAGSCWRISNQISARKCHKEESYFFKKIEVSDLFKL